VTKRRHFAHGFIYGASAASERLPTSLPFTVYRLPDEGVAHFNTTLLLFNQLVSNLANCYLETIKLNFLRIFLNDHQQVRIYKTTVIVNI